MSPETATDPRIRPAIASVGRPPATPKAAEPASAPKRPDAPFSARGHSGGNRVTDYGPGADHPTVEGHFGFAELLDVINPLQHLPLVSSLYRRITGDEIATPARVMGGALYGGPAGFLIASATALVAEIGGDDPGGQILARLFGPAGDDAPAPALAERQARGEHHPPAFQGGNKDPDALSGPTVPDALVLDAPDQVPAGPDETLTADQALFAERMMLALDKYQALPAPKDGGPQPRPGGLDLVL